MASGARIRGLPRRTALLGLAGLGALTLGGCRLAVDEARGADGGGPRPGGTFVLAVNTDAIPRYAQAYTPSTIAWRGLVFETLINYDTNGAPRPVLATGWELADGGRTVTVHLRDDVKFHSGRPMAGQDVTFSLRRAAQPAAQSQARSIAALITDMSVPDPHTVQIRLNRPAGNLTDLFAIASVVDSETARGLEDGREVIGTGPFVWRSWQPGSQLTLVRNPSYRVAGRPYLDRVDQPLITDPTALVTAARGGRAQVAYGVSPLDAKGLSKDDRFDVVRGISVAYTANMNVTLPPFDRKEVRQAVGYAVDRERVLNQVFGGYGEASSLWWSRKEPGWNAEQSTAYTYDPERARRMISGAGAAGARVTIDLIATLAVQGMAQIVRYDLEAAGLRVDTRVLDNADYSNRNANGTLGQMFLNGYGTSDLSAASMVGASPAYLPSNNASHFDTPEYTALVNAAAAATEAQRPVAVRRLAGYLQDQAFSQCLVVSNSVSVQAKRARDIAQTGIGTFQLDNTYLV